jgi:hypothetical protein
MFKTDRTVYKYKEGIYDLMDEKNMNIVSGYDTILKNKVKNYSLEAAKEAVR